MFDKTIKLKHLFIAVGLILITYYGFNSYTNTNYLKKELNSLKSDRDSILNINDRLTYELVEQETKIKDGEKVINQYKWQLKKTLKTLSQIKKEYQNETINDTTTTADKYFYLQSKYGK